MKVLTQIDSFKIITNPVKGIPRNPILLKYARQNRKKGVLSEVLFWKQVRANNFFGIDFHRQFVIGNYIADFYVPKLGLVVEIDGASHIGKYEYDNIRENYFRNLGIVVYKITDLNVKKDLSRVFQDLRVFIIENFGS